ncbi:MAG TPA: hypothetical protein VI160_11795 [Gemmatimonadales bacterium]
MAQLTIEAYAERMRRALGARLVSLLLFGSAARTGGRPGPSADTLLICDAADGALFDAIGPLVWEWIKAGHPAPLIFTDDEWRDSADVFAIEFEDARAAYRLLAGRDPWAGITVARADVRLQLEHELRGKVIRLRQTFAAVHGDSRALARAVGASVAGVLTMWRALLRLAGRPVPPDAAAVIRDAAALVGFPPAPVESVAAAGRGLTLADRDPRARDWLDAVARTAQYVNALPTRSA